MSENKTRSTLLERYYLQYLADENSADFIAAVSREYHIGTLERLYHIGDRNARRASILSIGFLGDFGCNEIMGLALTDNDRGVRMLADHGIREIWSRQGSMAEQSEIQLLYRLNDRDCFEEVVVIANHLLHHNCKLAEAWNQRAIALCAMGDFEGAVEDCRETLNCNRFHFPAAMGLAHCCLELEEPYAALDGFRLALKINPDLDLVRQQVLQLEQSLDEK